MKSSPLSLTVLLALPLSALGQAPPESAVAPAPINRSSVPDLPPPAPSTPTLSTGALDLPTPPPAAVANPAPVRQTVVTETVTPPIEPNVADAEAAAKAQQYQLSDSGAVIKDAALNDIFQILAKQAGKQYFHNSRIGTPEYRVTGILNDGDPLKQMDDLATMYGLTLYNKGATIYALTPAQLSQLPSIESHYQLAYLRPSDIEQIKSLIQPMLSPGTGIVNFEPKTNTIIMIDTAKRIEDARNLLRSIDQAKGQIVVETKIIRINSTAAERTGINWSNSLGTNGVSLTLTKSLNSIFGLNDPVSTATGTGTGTGTGSTSTAAAGNLVLSPAELSGVLHALAEGGFAKQVSNPTLITEDNEPGSISIIDRVPIITTTVTQNNSSNNITEEVRYKIDKDDKSIADSPENHREIGISVSITPTLLPDGTIRMKMRPRSAQITEEIVGQSGNKYPRVTESMVESLARVPDGHSLVVGGFYGETLSNSDTKVPVLGDIPVINFFFKSKETTKEHTSLVFVVTPTSYNPVSKTQNLSQGNRVKNTTLFPQDHDWVDPHCNPGPAHEPNIVYGLRELRQEPAPTYALPVAPDTTAATKPKTKFNPTRK
jgi:type II secretory pathway component GspD/PulD (secretin)